MQALKRVQFSSLNTTLNATYKMLTKEGWTECTYKNIKVLYLNKNTGLWSYGLVFSRFLVWISDVSSAKLICSWFSTTSLDECRHGISASKHPIFQSLAEFIIHESYLRSTPHCHTDRVIKKKISTLSCSKNSRHLLPSFSRWMLRVPQNSCKFKAGCRMSNPQRYIFIETGSVKAEDTSHFGCCALVAWRPTLSYWKSKCLLQNMKREKC